MPTTPSVKLALVDDHTLFRKGLISLIEVAFSNANILFEADNGLELQQKIDQNNPPDIILMDINMPGMDGFASVRWLNKNYPLVKILIVSMVDKEETIMRMLRLGIKGYLGKDVEPKEISEALQIVMNQGLYYADNITGKIINAPKSAEETNFRSSANKMMNEREKEFLQLACSELTYSEIADKMFLSPKTIDGYRNALFEKLNVKSRVGLALFAVKNGLVDL